MCVVCPASWRWLPSGVSIWKLYCWEPIACGPACVRQLWAIQQAFVHFRLSGYVYDKKNYHMGYVILIIIFMLLVYPSHWFLFIKSNWRSLQTWRAFQQQREHPEPLPQRSRMLTAVTTVNDQNQETNVSLILLTKLRTSFRFQQFFHWSLSSPLTSWLEKKISEWPVVWQRKGNRN